MEAMIDFLENQTAYHENKLTCYDVENIQR